MKLLQNTQNVNISLFAMKEEEYTQEEDHLAHLEYLINSEKAHGKKQVIKKRCLGTSVLSTTKQCKKIITSYLTQKSHKRSES